LCVGAYGSQVEIVSPADVNVSFVCHKNVTIAPRGLTGDESQEKEKRAELTVAGNGITKQQNTCPIRSHLLYVTQKSNRCAVFI
jgi:hypothetical protein